MSDGTLFTKEKFDIVFDTLEERIYPNKNKVNSFFLSTTNSILDIDYSASLETMKIF